MFKRKIKQNVRQLQLYIKYYSFLPARKSNTRCLVFMLNNVIKHGGLLDRIKGIVSASVIAEAAGYAFKIYVDKKSFNLFKFLLPVNGNLVASDDDMVYNIWASKPVLLYNLTALSKEDILSLLKKKKDQYHFYCNLDQLKQFYPTETQEGLNTVWRNTFNSLFTFDSYFGHYAQGVFGASKNICGIHLRFLSLLGDFSEGLDNILPEQEKQLLIEKCTKQVHSIVEKGVCDKYLVVSDSVVFLQALKTNMQNCEYAEKVIILGGAIAHIDLDHREEVLQKTILDFYLLAKCSIVYQILAPKMYKSQFCKYAAVLGNAPYIIEKI